MRPAIYFLPAYVLLDWVSYVHPVLPLAVTPWNPPPGIGLAFLLLAGIRRWPWLFAAALSAELLVRDIPLGLPWVVAAASILALAYAGLAWFLGAWVKIDARLHTLRDLTWLIGGCLLAALVAGIAYVGLYTLAGIAATSDLPGNVLRFWIGDSVGLLVTAPLLLVWADRRPALPPVNREGLLQAGSLALTLWVTFGIPYTEEFKFFYLLYLPMVWIATRHGIAGVTLALAVTQLGLIGALAWGGYHAATVQEFQMLMLGLTVTGLFLGMTVTVRQSAEERLHRRETELNQALRLAAAGEMAQALAHELNQPLSALANYSRVSRAMLDAPEHGPLLADTLEKIERESTRAGQVVRRLREFFRGGGLRLESVGVAALVEEGLAPARRRAERLGADIRVAIQDDLPEPRADRVQIGMVLHNLVANALDAIGVQPETARHIDIVVGPQDAGRVRFCVSDSGPGIAEEMSDRLFESFATSKPEGMGLGLSISRTLVEAHGGELWLEAAQPTQFCFTLPVDTERADTMPDASGRPQT
jgi:two-component system sensor kinase FixL